MKPRRLSHEGDCCPEIKEPQSGTEWLQMMLIEHRDTAEPGSCFSEKMVVERIQSTSAHRSVKQSCVLSCVPGSALIEPLRGPVYLPL